MRGNFKLKRINKKTGESEVILEEKNQVAAGFATAITNVLTSTGSRNKDDYLFRYFQLGDNNYNLSSYGVSADIPEERLKGKVWTMKSPLDISDYGRDSILPVVKRDTYFLGSFESYYKTKVMDNFVDPPDNTLQIGEYTNKFNSGIDPEPRGSLGKLTLNKTTWVNGCANTWEHKIEHTFHWPLWVSSAGPSILGPDLATPATHVQYNGSANVNNMTSCNRIDWGYISGKTGQTRPALTMKRNQTFSEYHTTNYYGSDSGQFGSTPVAGAIQFFNRTAQVMASTQAAQNRMSFMYRYNLEYSSSDAGAEWYPPYIIPWETYGGFDKCKEDTSVGGCLEKWDAAFTSSVGAGIVSGNVACSAGEMYDYAIDVLGAPPGDRNKPYSTMNGPGADCSGQPNSGFGPKGNFYRVSVSWNDVPDAILNFENNVIKGSIWQVMSYSLLSALDTDFGTDGVGSGPDYWGNDYDFRGDEGHNLTPREVGYVANSQQEYNKQATPYQYIHGERPYYLTTPQYFVQIPEAYSTSLNDNTINVRLLLDEYLANGKTIKEVALFLKNPTGQGGEDSPFMSGYKVIDPPLQKNIEFSYIIDWELSVIDTDSI